MSKAKENKSETAGNAAGESSSADYQKPYGDFLGAYKSFSETSSNMVQHAAKVMESEIAAVIKVAKDVEQRSPIGEQLRSEKPDEIVQRFRRDAHEVLDIFVDVFSVSLTSINYVGNKVMVTSPGTKTEPTAVGPRSLITAPHSVKAGGLAEFPISFENSADVPTDEFKLYSTDLISDSGGRISPSQIKFVPSTLRIPSHQTERVMVIIAVPKETLPGVYTGLVLAANMNQLRSEIILKVE
jgi:hypothetical protein